MKFVKSQDLAACDLHCCQILPSSHITRQGFHPGSGPLGSLPHSTPPVLPSSRRLTRREVASFAPLAEALRSLQKTPNEQIPPHRLKRKAHQFEPRAAAT